MLELKNIKKDYLSADNTVHALRGVDVAFRKNEFVAILGPSGCGKTTLLNIIGGLDQYTDGDLVINGRSTKDFFDRDWDAYRNHSVGFVFQSYNLIPHQTVLQNVELALTLSGVGRLERRKRAIEALESVGLGDQLKKKPSQMSGGQMQRVAIARALVNNPDIILADEPTGALDSQTSVQIMEILKEVSKERLVVMVTHNPELADTYATRIVRLLDGNLMSDSAPLTREELAQNQAASEEKKVPAKKEKKPSMKWRTSFGLSLKNLIAKKNRTMLTSFAGSIGIIGIALIYAVSQGVTYFIDDVQEDTLSSYPLTIEASAMDLGTLMSAFLETAQSGQAHDKDAVYAKEMVYKLINALNNAETTENDLKAFKAYLEAELADPESPLHEALNGIQYTYDMNLLVYTKNVDGKIVLSDAQELLQELMAKFMGMDMSGMMNNGSSSNMMSMITGSANMGSFKVWQEMLPGKNGAPINDLIYKQYDLVYGSWPNSYNEIVIVLDQNNELDDMSLYALGLKSKAEMEKVMQAAVNGTPLPVDGKSWSYEEICAMEFTTLLPGDCYKYDESTGTYYDLRDTELGLQLLYDNGTKLKVTGIIRPNEDAVAGMLTGSIAYTSELTEYVIENARKSGIVQAQLSNSDKNILTGQPFKAEGSEMTAEEKATLFLAYIDALDEAGKAKAYIKIMSIPSQEQLDAMVSATLGSMTVEQMRAMLIQETIKQTGMGEQEITAYIMQMDDAAVIELVTSLIVEGVKQQTAAQAQAQLGNLPTAQLVMMLSGAMQNFTTEQCAAYYDVVPEFSEQSYEEMLIALGCVDLDDPATVNLYASSFENKDVIVQMIDEYNAGVDETKKLQYTDYVGLMMSSITTIINAIAYVLIAFVAISLVVSSIMIGVITLISVQERTKEIGILRAIGASKRNVSNMFNAETVMIGAASGVVGIVITYLLCIPINAIIYYFTGLGNLQAFLPWPAALALIGVSILLSVFAGVIPARSAAKKDPVVALRTE